MIFNPNKLLLTILSNRLGRSATNLELTPRLKAIGKKLPELSENEKNDIVATWNSIANGILNLDYWRFYKAILGTTVSASIVPDNIYWSRIIRTLNPVSYTRTFINKSLYPIIFKGIRQPKIIVNIINGVPYNDMMDVISYETAIESLKHSDKDIIIKPTRATSGGAGVVRISSKSTSIELKQVLSSLGDNLICQEAVSQSASTEVFNKSSLNTFRVNTINLNGVVSCECIMMRHGLNGNVVDNFAMGGIACGMDKNGHFNGLNFNSKLQLVKQSSEGIDYTDYSISAISDVIATAIDSHQRYMPHIGHAAWDFAIDIHEKPVMIEVNLMLPGIILEQLTSGSSIFGDRTEEIISYAMKRKNRLSWTEFVGGW